MEHPCLVLQAPSPITVSLSPCGAAHHRVPPLQSRALLLQGELGQGDMGQDEGNAYPRCCCEGCLGGQGTSLWGLGARGLHWRQSERGSPGAPRGLGSIGGGGLGQERGCNEGG